MFWWLCLPSFILPMHVFDWTCIKGHENWTKYGMHLFRVCQPHKKYIFVILLVMLLGWYDFFSAIPLHLFKFCNWRKVCSFCISYILVLGFRIVIHVLLTHSNYKLMYVSVFTSNKQRVSYLQIMEQPDV
jgi:hypothetical protein